MVDMWMVRAGENAFLIDEFKDLNVVAIGWELGDLSGKSPDEIKHLVSKTYKNTPKKSLDIYSAQIIRFVHEFKVGDYVLSYDPLNQKYLFGIISSDYYYSDILEKKYDYDVYTNFRKVDWLGEFSRNYLNNKTKKI